MVTRADGKLINVARKTGQLFVCSKGCCCGDTARGFKAVPEELYHNEWTKRKLRNKVHLTVGGCLGPCPLANVILLFFDGQPIWFHSMYTQKQVETLFDYIEQMIAVQSYLPPPPLLSQYHFNAFNWSLSALEKHDAQIKKNEALRLNEFLFLTQADTDVMALSVAVEKMEPEFPKVHAYNIGYLSTDQDIESFLKAKLPESGVVVVRLHRTASFLSGLRYIAKYAETHDLWLVCVQGTDAPDPELTAFSNVDLATVNETVAYLQANGVENYLNLLKFLSDHLLMTGFGYEQPKQQSRYGIYHPRVPEGTYEAWKEKINSGWPTLGLLFYSSHYFSGNFAFVDAIIKEAERQHLNIMPVYAYSLKDFDGAEAESLPFALQPFVKNGKTVIDALISTMSFALGSTERESNDDRNWTGSAFQRLGIPVIQAINASISHDQWESSLRGLPPLDVGINIAIPEFDGRIISVPISFKESIVTKNPEFGSAVVQNVPDIERIARLIGQTKRLTTLQRKPNADKRIAIILTNYNAKASSIGNAVGLDTPASLLGLLRSMAERGYTVTELPESSDKLLHNLIERGTYENESITEEQAANAVARVPKKTYAGWFDTLPSSIKSAVASQWGEPPGKYYVDSEGNLVLAGLDFGNAFVAVQPPRGYGMDPSLIYHATDLPTPHPYEALYSWLTRSKDVGGWGADAILHMGKHGTLEWLPGKGVGISAECFPDALLGDLPLIYPFIVNDPGEGAQAKRRAHAVIIDHMTPPMTVAEGYEEIEQLTQLVSEFYQMEKLDPDKLPALQRQIWALIKQAKLDKDLGVLMNRDSNTHTHEWDPQFHEDGVPYTVSDMTGKDFAHLVDNINAYLCDLTSAQIRSGLHILGKPPVGQALSDTLLAILRVPNLDAPSIRNAVGSAFGFSMEKVVGSLEAKSNATALESQLNRHITTNADVLRGVDDICVKLINTLEIHAFSSGSVEATVDSTLDWRYAKSDARGEIVKALRFACDKLVPNLKRTTEEFDNLFVALDGKYVPPGPSGAPTRGMADVLPTGRNFYSLDPRGIPSSSAWEVGTALAASLIDKHMKDTGTYPQSVGISIWGTSVMRTFGDDVAEVLALLGVRPKWQPQSRRVTGIELISLEELGRPRIDVVCRISGFFRDAFPDLITLMDEAFQLVGNLNEPADQNYVAAHFRAEKEALVTNGTAEMDAVVQASYRIFGSKPGSYGAGILPLVNAGNWQNEADLAETFLNWGGYAYTRKEFGTDARPQFARTLTTVRVAVKNQDNREHDIFDSDDYFQFHGGMIATIKALSGKSPLKYFGDSANPEKPKVRDLKEEAMRVFRSRVVNPKWVNSIQKHGYKGAMELAATVDYMFGYDATSKVVDDWMYERLAQTYVLDPKMQEFFKQSNPWALKDILQRLIEAIDRGLWKDPGELREELQWMYLSMQSADNPAKS